MKYKSFAVILLAIPLAACGAGSTLDTAFKAVTTTIVNPVGPVDIYRVKLAYAAADKLVDDYRTYCYRDTYIVLMADPISKPACQNRRAVIRTAQSYRRTASAAINQADIFVHNNPTINAATVVNAAWAAVTAYQSYVPVVPKI